MDTNSSNEFFRISKLPPYQLGDIAEAIRTSRLSGIDVIDLSQVNPSFSPPSLAVDKLVQSSLQSHNHKYSSSQGIRILREAIRDYYFKRFSVSLDTDSDIVVTMGCKEGISHLLLAVLSPNDNVIVPTPSYPIHTAAVFIAGAGVVGLPLFYPFTNSLTQNSFLSADSNDFFQRLDFLYHQTWPRPKLMLLSFPHNPTTTVVSKCFFERLVKYALERELYLVHDFAYGELCYGDYKAPSLLQIPEAKEIAVEFYSLSKSFSLGGWRIGFCLGNKKLTSALKRIKSYVDYGIFQPLQIAASHLLKNLAKDGTKEKLECLSYYESRCKVLCTELRASGFELVYPRATVYVWARLPVNQRHIGSMQWAKRALAEASVAVCPGEGFSIDAGEYVRFALVEDERRLRTAVERLKSARLCDL